MIIETYERARLTVTEFDEEDVITTSAVTPTVPVGEYESPTPMI